MSARESQYLAKYVAKQNAQILDLNIKLNHLCHKYDLVNTRREQLDSQLAIIQSTSSEETLKLGRIRMYVRSLLPFCFTLYCY